jgi:hypothetical protein
MIDPSGWRESGVSLGAAVVMWIGAVPMMVRGAPEGDDLGWVSTLETAVEVEDFMERHPVEWDWLRQDCGLERAREVLTGERRVIGAVLLKKVIEGIPDDRERLGQAFEQLLQAGVEDGDVAWLRLYAEAAEVRRAGRLAGLARSAPRVVFVRRRTIRPSFFAYTEGQSDAQAERHFLPDSALCLLTLDGTRGVVDELLADTGGVIRDPAVSWDGRRVAFAWKKSLDGDDYQIHELDMETREVRRITGGKGVADYEPAYLVLTQARRDGGGRGDGPFRGHAEGAMVRWISSQSVPTPLEPGFAGSTRSGLLELLDGGHFGVKLTTGEYEKIACWIDLLVPFCGDYTEGNLWTEKEMAKFRHFEAKRKDFEMLEQEAIRDYLRSTGDGKEPGD